MASLPTVSLAKDLRLSIQRGHPWIYDRALARMPSSLAPGDLAVVTFRGQRLAVGVVDPGRAIAMRVLDRDPHAVVGDAWVRERARQAAACRQRDPHLACTNAFRVIHGENDFMPGLVLDRYDDTGVIVFDGAAAAAFWAPRLHAVMSGIEAAGLSIPRLWARPIKGAGPARTSAHAGALRGPEPPEVVIIHENGAALEVDVRRGQKTGLFLDQRENRGRVRALAAGRRVLNLFAYTGGFSVHAALGGARHVTSLDAAGPAMAAARRNVARSGLPVDAHAFVTGDAFAFLDRCVASQERYDLVVLDPPSFAPSERARPRALAAYQALNRLALQVVAPGGLLMSASCSSHVTTADLMDVIAAAAVEARRGVRVLEVHGAATDHPELPAFPEGQYLSFVVLHVA